MAGENDGNISKFPSLLCRSRQGGGHLTLNSSTMNNLKSLSSDVVTAVNKLDFRFTASRKASALKTIAALQAAVEALDAVPPKAVNAPTPPKAEKAAPKAKPTTRKTRTAKPRTSSADKLENKSAAQSTAKQALPVNSSPIGAVTKADKVSKPKAANAPTPSKTAKPRTKAEAVAMGLKVVETKPKASPKASQPKAANTKPSTASPQGLDQITEAMSAIANAVGANATRIESLEQRVARIEAEQIALQSFDATF